MYAAEQLYFTITLSIRAQDGRVLIKTNFKSAIITFNQILQSVLKIFFFQSLYFKKV